MTQTPKRKLKAGDPVMLPSGLVTELTDIQYEHNRYQLLEAVSGWQYGIEQLQPADWKTEARKWRKEALRKYPTPEAYEAVCGARDKHQELADAAEEQAKEWRERTRQVNMELEAAESSRDKAYNMIGHKSQEIAELRVALAESEAREQQLKKGLEDLLGIFIDHGHWGSIPVDGGFVHALEDSDSDTFLRVRDLLPTLYPDTPAPTTIEGGKTNE